MVWLLNSEKSLTESINVTDRQTDGCIKAMCSAVHSLCLKGINCAQHCTAKKPIAYLFITLTQIKS